jgi:hypothetical protein
LDFAFSDLYFSSTGRSDSAAPAELAERGLLFGVAPEELDPELASALGEQVPYELLEAVADDLWRQSLSEFLWEQRPATRARFVMLPGLGAVSRSYFAGYTYSQFEGTQKRAHQRAADSLLAYYRHLDGFLGRAWDHLGERRLLAVVSAHGYAPPAGLGRLWRWVTGRGVEGLAAGAPDGLLLLAGEGVQAGELLDRAALVDIMPTLLYAMELPIARDLDGEVLTGAFETFLAHAPATLEQRSVLDHPGGRVQVGVDLAQGGDLHPLAGLHAALDSARDEDPPDADLALYMALLADNQVSFRDHPAREPAINAKRVFEVQIALDMAARVEKAVQVSPFSFGFEHHHRPLWPMSSSYSRISSSSE